LATASEALHPLNIYHLII